MTSARWILVTDAETRGTVAACRGLAQAGYRVAAAAGTGRAPAHWSRSCHQRLTVPHPVDDPEGFVGALEHAVSDGTYAVLLPGSDASLLSISHARDRLERHVRLGLPPHDVVLRGVDKPALGDAAAAVGLPPPETAVCWDVEEALAAARGLGFPVVLKAAQSVFMAHGAIRRSGSVRVGDEDALRALVPDYGESTLIQRSEAGSVVSFAGAMADGRLIGTAVSRYRRTWYPEAGNACFSESIEPARDLTERVEALLARLEWQGIFELELIERPDGTYTSIDLNPRIYGSLALAVSAGANLPAVWCDYTLGGRPEPVVARAGFRYRWEDADLRHLLRQARRGHVAAAASVVRPRRRVAHAHFRLDDPGPLLARGVSLAGLARRRGRPVAQATTEPDVRDPTPNRSNRHRPDPGTVVVLGAGPYGLAVTSHLRAAGVRARIFGEPLEFWRTQMPKGMILRSRKRSSHIADPERALSIDHFAEAEDRTLRAPSLTLEEFVDYGVWYQRRAAPDVDRRKVGLLERQDGGFRLELEDGEEIEAARVVVAAGLFPFGRWPEPFASLPRKLVSHASDHRDLGQFAERDVLVVGAGQSALESAALLWEVGARVEVLARTPELFWLPDDTLPPAPKRGFRQRLPKPPTDVGGFSTGWAAALPDLYRRLPPRLRPVVSYRCIRPAGSGWLRPRLEEVPIETERVVVSAEASNGSVRVGLSDGSERTADHVLLGTGYEIDVRRYPFLHPDLAREIEVVDGYPVLRPGLESSVPGIHFVGAPAALTFGPIMRFVVGTWYAAPALTRRALGRLQRPLQTSF